MWAVEMRVDGRAAHVGARGRRGARRRTTPPARRDVHLASRPPRCRRTGTPTGSDAAVGRGPQVLRAGPGRPTSRTGGSDATRSDLVPTSDLIASARRRQGPPARDLHAVPYQGLRLERRYVLARGTDGRPVLWRQRRTVPLLGTARVAPAVRRLEGGGRFVNTSLQHWPALVITSGPEAGRSFTIGDGEVVIGRADDANIVLDSSSVSRHHACLRRDGDTVMIEDLQSTNGTHVNGDRLTGPASLKRRRLAAARRGRAAVRGDRDARARAWRGAGHVVRLRQRPGAGERGQRVDERRQRAAVRRRAGLPLRRQLRRRGHQRLLARQTRCSPAPVPGGCSRCWARSWRWPASRSGWR